MVTIHKIDEPIGIDSAIQQLQISFGKKLKWNNTEVFGRVYKKKSGNSVLPQAYFKEGEYKKDVLTNDKGNSRIFFIVDAEEKALPGGQFEVEVKTVVITDLTDTFTTVNHRADLEARNHIHDIIKSNGLFRNVTKIETEAEKVLNGFDYKKAEKLDVQPMHIFAVVSKVIYYLNTNC